METDCCYDNPRYDYRVYWRLRAYEDQSERLALKKLLPLVKKRGFLIDVGAGFGRLTPNYAPFFKKCLLIDPSARMLAESKRLRRHYRHLEFKKAVSEKLPADSETADLLLFIRTSHHLPTLDRTIEEFARVLKKNGSLIIEFPNKIHAKANLSRLFHFNLAPLFNLQGINRSRSHQVFFYNYHPTQVQRLLVKNHFQIKKILSVSNLRHPWLKKLLPLSLLLKIENFLQPILGKVYFGPSIFILAQKN